MDVQVFVTYEDDSVQSGLAAEWTSLRSDGVQKVIVECNGLSVMFHASSLYWLYPEGLNFVAGSGSVRYDPNPLAEIVIAPDGSQTERRIESMPDLNHNQVKLGWWKYG